MKNNSLFTANAFTSYNKLCNVIIFLITLILFSSKNVQKYRKKIQEKKYIYISIFLVINNNNIKILT